jgi:hypothetical protein
MPTGPATSQSRLGNRPTTSRISCSTQMITCFLTGLTTQPSRSKRQYCREDETVLIHSLLIAARSNES